MFQQPRAFHCPNTSWSSAIKCFPLGIPFGARAFNASKRCGFPGLETEIDSPTEQKQHGQQQHMEELPALSHSHSAVRSVQKTCGICITMKHPHQGGLGPRDKQSIPNPSCLPSLDMPRRMSVGQPNPTLPSLYPRPIVHRSDPICAFPSSIY